MPVGTDYHWYIVGHQYVCKLNANDYTTSLTGLKFKVAHKRADTGAWSATPVTQRKRMIKFLKEVIDELEHPSTAEPFPLDVIVRRRIKEAGFVGLGVEFMDKSKETRSQLCAFLGIPEDET